MIVPYRTDTNIRYYDDIQLKKLLNVATLSAAGFKISKIAGMSDLEIAERIKAEKEKEFVTLKYDFYINDFISAMLDFDEPAFDMIFQTVIEKFGVETAVIEILYPFLNKTGMLWSVNEATPLQEHFASTLIKKKLFSLINNLPHPINPKKKFLLFLPSNEWHELGLLFAEYLIRNQGHLVVNLGQNVPFTDLEHVIKRINPNYLLTFLVADAYEDQMKQIQKLLSSKFKKTLCLVSGSPNRLKFYIGSSHVEPLSTPNSILKFF